MQLESMRPSLAAPPPPRTIQSPEDEARYNSLACFIFEHYGPASGEELRITNDILHGTWLMQNWKQACAKARRFSRELKLNEAPVSEILAARENWRFCEWHATKQALYTARRKKAWAVIRAEYEGLLAGSGYSIAEARQHWLSSAGEIEE